jgi:hypothetical protein
MGEPIVILHDRRMRNLEYLAINYRISALDVFNQTLELMNEVRSRDIETFEQLMDKYEALKSQMEKFTDLFHDSEFDRKSLESFLKKRGLSEDYRNFYERRKMNTVYYQSRKKQKTGTV